MNHIHKTAFAGFSAEAEAYDRGRPSYPPAAIATLVNELGLSATASVVDLAAGTGKFTALLPPVARLVAVEPLPAMRAILERRLPAVEAVEGTADSLPLDDGSFDAMTVAQAFHWFDTLGALTEMRRVLRDGSALGLIWNVRDESAPWVAEMMGSIRPFREGTPSYTDGTWANVFGRQALFDFVMTQSVYHEHRCSIEEATAQVASISYVAALDRPTRLSLLKSIAKRLAEWHGSAQLVFPYRTDIWVYRAV